MTDSKNINIRFAGLDLAKESIFACIVDFNGLREENKFLTTLIDLIRLKEWLHSYQVQQVAMENTGIYTEPVIAVLHTEFEVEVVNAADTKRSNKKKTDQDDAWWLAELLKAGTIGKGKRITSSVLLSPKQQTLRKLTRMKSKCSDHATRQKNRIHKVFDRLNIKITSIFGDNKFTITALRLYAALV